MPHTPIQTVQVPQAPTVPPPGTTTLPATDLATMQAQLADLRIQQAGLQAQQSALRSQLNSMRIDNPARAGVQQQSANVGVQLAQVQGDIAALQARIQQRQGGTTQPSGNPFGRRSPDPNLVFAGTMMLMIAIAFPLSVAFARRIWRGKPQPAGPRVDEIAPRLDRMEQAVDTIAIEIERISEGQRFVTKILAERPAQTAARPEGQAVEVNGEQPILALGAGAVEPIRVGERQAVRQANTPR